MDVLLNLEEREELLLDSQKLKNLKKENVCNDLEKAYVDFIEEFIKRNPNVTIKELEVSRKFLDFLKSIM